MKIKVLTCLITLCFIIEIVCVTFNVPASIFVLTRNNMDTYITSLTALFFHHGFLHYANNVITLFVLGYYMEVYEKRTNVIWLFLLGAVANYFYAVFFMGVIGGLMGASSGIYVLKGYALFTANYFLIRIFIAWSILSNVLYIISGEQDNIAYEVHVIGAGIGMFFGLIELLREYNQSKSIE